MTDQKELEQLVAKMKAFGAVVNVEYDVDALLEGRTIIDTVQITNVKGIGTFPMSAISAAEAMRAAIARSGKIVRVKGDWIVEAWIKE